MSSILRPISTSALTGWAPISAATCHEALDGNYVHPNIPDTGFYIFASGATFDVTLGMGNLPGQANRLLLPFYVSLEDDAGGLSELVTLVTTLTCGSYSEVFNLSTRGDGVRIEEWALMSLNVPARAAPLDSNAVSVRFQLSNPIGAMVEAKIYNVYVLEDYRGSPLMDRRSYLMGMGSV